MGISRTQYLRKHINLVSVILFVFAHIRVYVPITPT